MALRVREIDSDLLADTTETAPVMHHTAIDVVQDDAADGVASPTPALNPALDDIVADIGGGVFQQVPLNLVIHGTAGNDYLVGGAGNDVMRGLAGDDFIVGGDGNDSISGDAGNDMVFGGEGHDQINGNDGDDLLRGNAGNDSLWGANGNDILEGSEGDDRIEGGDGLDALFGGAGNDQMKGGGYADTLDGGDGSDKLDGGKGTDTLTGGEGRDFFVADLNGDAWSSHHYRSDVITDFTAPGTVRDCIDLRVVMAKTLFTGTTVQQAVDQGFLYLNEYAYDDGNGNTVFGTKVMIDYNGLAADSHNMGDIGVFDLQNVHANQLGFSTYASHFLL
jgi:Ca2+-binding RTX toxin-like protein